MPSRPVPLQLPKGVKPWASDDSEYDLDDDSDMVAAIKELSSGGASRIEEKADSSNGRRIYLLNGEEAPTGAEVVTGPRGGRFFVPDGGSAQQEWVNARRKAARVRAKFSRTPKKKNRTAGELLQLEARPISISGGEKVIKQLGKAIGTDSDQYSPFVREGRDRCRQLIIEYLRGSKPSLSEFSDGHYGSVILDDPSNYEVIFKDGWAPAISGKWMGFEEEHWGLSKQDYKSMKEEDRAELDCREQVSKWIPDQFYGRWLETYHPEDYDRLWFAQGGSMTYAGRTHEWQVMLKLVAERIRKEGPSAKSELEDAMDIATSVSQRFSGQPSWG